MGWLELIGMPSVGILHQSDCKYLDLLFIMSIRGTKAGKASKAWALPIFWVSICSYKKQPVKKIWSRILGLAWLKFTVAPLSMFFYLIFQARLITNWVEPKFSSKTPKICFLSKNGTAFWREKYLFYKDVFEAGTIADGFWKCARPPLWFRKTTGLISTKDAIKEWKMVRIFWLKSICF